MGEDVIEIDAWFEAFRERHHDERQHRIDFFPQGISLPGELRCSIDGDLAHCLAFADQQ